MRNEARKEIDIQEYVPINGIDQFLYHLGTRYENPVCCIYMVALAQQNP